MLSQAELETILAIGIVLVCLAASINIYWILNGWQIEAIRRTFAKVMRPMVTRYLRAIDER